MHGWLSRYEHLSTCGISSTNDHKLNVLAIYAESSHEYRHSDGTALACGADWIDMNTYPPAENAPPRTRRLLNTWNTGFAITTSQCSGHLCCNKPWIQRFWWYSTAVSCGADWIHMNTFPPAEYPPPTTRRLFNTWKTCFVINVSQCSKPNHEQRLSDATALACGADWLDLNTFPSAEYLPPRTRRLLNTWKTGFAVMESQCSGHFYRIKPRTFWSYCSSTQCWLTRPEDFSTCGTCSTKDQKTIQQLKKWFCH